MSTVITREVFRYLANHVWEIQDNKINVINKFAKDFNLYMSVLNFINSYTKTIDNYLDMVKTGSGAQKLPFVILDSVVHVADLTEGRITQYKIILPPKEPQEDDIGAEIKKISCFTELAKSLLFKGVNEKVSIENNDKKTIGKIERIEFDLLL